MVYHEIREVKGKKQNYLVYNRRKNGKWIKKSKFIGYGKISKKAIEKLKEEFELELKINQKHPYLDKEEVKKIEKLKEAYDKRVNELDKDELKQLQTSFFTELTYNSNAIEGNSLSLEETSLVINEGLVPEGKSLREIYEAKNHAKALVFLKKYKGRLTEQFILKLHSIISENILEKFSGRYRESRVRIFRSDVKFPEANLVPQLMKNLIYWYNKNKKKYHPFEMAVIFSMKLVTIHPFVDGNGRVSRLIMNFLLERKNYPWVNIYMKQRAEYLRAVRKANDEEHGEIIDFLIKTLEDNLKSFKFID